MSLNILSGYYNGHHEMMKDLDWIWSLRRFFKVQNHVKVYWPIKKEMMKDLDWIWSLRRWGRSTLLNFAWVLGSDSRIRSMASQAPLYILVFNWIHFPFIYFNWHQFQVQKGTTFNFYISSDIWLLWNDISFNCHHIESVRWPHKPF